MNGSGRRQEGQLRLMHCLEMRCCRPQLGRCNKNSFHKYPLSSPMPVVQKYGLREVKVSRGEFYLDCQMKLKGMVMEPDFEGSER